MDQVRRMGRFRNRIGSDGGGTWSSHDRFQLIAIDDETATGRAGQEFLRKEIQAIADGEISGLARYLYLLRNGNGVGGVFGDGSEGIVNSHANTWGHAYVPYEDESRGVEFQLHWRPAENLQVQMGYAYLENRVTSERYEYVSLPSGHSQAEFGRWALPTRSSGTLGLPVDQAFADPTDPSTCLIRPIESGGPSCTDTPADMVTWWARYTFHHGRFQRIGSCSWRILRIPAPLRL